MKKTTAELEVEADHRVVHEMANGILGALSKGPGSVEDLHDRVAGLLGKMRAHFASEEAHWSRDRGWKDDPTTARWVEGLVREHRSLEQRMRNFVDGLGSERDRSTVSPQVAASIRTILEEIFAHEFSETKLFQRREFEET